MLVRKEPPRRSDQSDAPSRLRLAGIEIDRLWTNHRPRAWPSRRFKTTTLWNVLQAPFARRLPTQSTSLGERNFVQFLPVLKHGGLALRPLSAPRIFLNEVPLHYLSSSGSHFYHCVAIARITIQNSISHRDGLLVSPFDHQIFHDGRCHMRDGFALRERPKIKTLFYRHVAHWQIFAVPNIAGRMPPARRLDAQDRKSTRLNSSH